MTRRGLLLGLIAIAARAQTPDTPKNRTAHEANAFERMFARWADAFNRTPHGAIDAGEASAFDPMPAQFRKFEHVRMLWIRGLK